MSNLLTFQGATYCRECQGSSVAGPVPHATGCSQANAPEPRFTFVREHNTLPAYGICCARCQKLISGTRAVLRPYDPMRNLVHVCETCKPLALALPAPILVAAPVVAEGTGARG